MNLKLIFESFEAISKVSSRNAKRDLLEEAGAEVGEGQKDDIAFDAKVKEIVDDKKNDWAEEQAAKAEEFTDLSPEG